MHKQLAQVEDLQREINRLQAALELKNSIKTTTVTYETQYRELTQKHEDLAVVNSNLRKQLDTLKLNQGDDKIKILEK